MTAMAVAGLFTVPASAAPTLRATALVSGELVTVGDLIDGAGAQESVALFRAPDPGQTGAVPAEAVLAAARRAGLADVSAGALTEVAVTRASRTIARAEIEALVTARAATELGVDIDAIAVTFDDGGPLHLDPTATGALGLGRFAADRQSGRFEAVIEVAGRSSQPLRVTGTAIETVEVATVGRALARGDVVAAAEIRRERVTRAEARDAIAPAEAAGLAAKRAIREGQPLKASDLTRPQHVERGAFVTLIYMAEGLSLSLKAKALAAGAAGDLVAVQNLQSKKTVNGVVTGPSEVTVTAAPTAIARR